MSPHRPRVRYVVALGDIHGVPERYQRVKLSIDHAQGKRRYATREGLVQQAVRTEPATGGAPPLGVATFGGEGGAGDTLEFTCHLRHHLLRGVHHGEYAPKEVVFTLTGSESDKPFGLMDIFKTAPTLATAKIDLAQLVSLDGSPGETEVGVPWHAGLQDVNAAGIAQRVTVRTEWIDRPPTATHATTSMTSTGYVRSPGEIDVAPAGEGGRPVSVQDVERAAPVESGPCRLAALAGNATPGPA